MVDIPPEIVEFAEKLKNKYPLLRKADSRFVTRALQDALEYRGSYFAYWQTKKAKYLFVFRLDRQPNNVEVLPFLQELFDDGQIHEQTGINHRAFFQGDVYTTDSADIVIANAIADASEKDSYASEFDFNRTALGKKMSRERGNGQS